MSDKHEKFYPSSYFQEEGFSPTECFMLFASHLALGGIKLVMRQAQNRDGIILTQTYMKDI
ncbi:hypothetical protein OAF54_00960 [bacterium]|nr:hypothetical protein [bacterium]